MRFVINIKATKMSSLLRSDSDEETNLKRSEKRSQIDITIDCFAKSKKQKLRKYRPYIQGK